MGLMKVFSNGLVLLSSGAESSTSFLDSGIFTFIAEGAKTVIGLFSIQPMGTFIGIGLVSAVVGLVAGIMRMVKH